MSRPRVLIADDHRKLREAYARQLRRAMPDEKVIFLTMNEDPDLAAEALRVGASGYLLKNSAASELLTAIREVAGGRSYVTPLMTREPVGSLLASSAPPAGAADLSPRQREVIRLLAEGQTMKEIARELKITPRTVAFHKYSIMELLGARSGADLIHFAIKHNIASDPPPAT